MPTQRPEPIALRAGPLSLVYDAGDLRYVKLGGREVLRRMGVAVRDRNWGTVPMRISQWSLAGEDHAFKISYRAEHRQGEIDFAWEARIEGTPEGEINFRMDGEARSTFLRNRIGFIVLHPIRECAGQSCQVEGVDGSVTEGQFPRLISPHQPFTDMAAISHEVAPGLLAEVRFAGEVFETEDQRNWTDGSYKTYGTPLRLPFPVEVRAGERFSQSVRLSLRGNAPRPGAGAEAGPILITLGAHPASPLPRLGLGAARRGAARGAQELGRLRALGLSHLRLDLDLAWPEYADDLRRGGAEARELGVPLEVALMLSDDAEAELAALRANLGRLGPPVARWLVFHRAEKSTTERWARLARARLESYAPAAHFGAGTNAYFAELNRGRPPLAALDFVCYSINPQVHAFDDASLVETLEAQGATVESAREFCGGLPLVVGPVTLRPRFNPNATAPEPEPGPDPRQDSLFGAGWTVGSLQRLAEAGVACLTYYETAGPRGVLEQGRVFPVYHALADAGEMSGGEIIPTASSDALTAGALAARLGARTRVLVANFTGGEIEVTVRNLAGEVRVRHLDETNAERAGLTPEDFRAGPGEWRRAAGALELRLRPHAVTRVDT